MLAHLLIAAMVLAACGSVAVTGKISPSGANFSLNSGGSITLNANESTYDVVVAEGYSFNCSVTGLNGEYFYCKATKKK